jgi:hypothetical protein
MGCVARSGNKRNAYRVCWSNLRERDHLEGLGVDWRIILRWIRKIWNGAGWILFLKYKEKWVSDVL